MADLELESVKKSSNNADEEIPAETIPVITHILTQRVRNPYLHHYDVEQQLR